MARKASVESFGNLRYLGRLELSEEKYEMCHGLS
jgi:hypothetical protein